MKLDHETLNMLREVAKAYGEAFGILKQNIQQIWQNVKEAIRIRNERDERKHNYNWSIPKVIELKDQVLIRKPTTINIRTNL